MSRFRGDIAIEMQTVTYWLLTACNQVQNTGFSDGCNRLGRSLGCKIKTMLDNGLPKPSKPPDYEKSLNP